MFGAKSYDEMKKTTSKKDDLYIVEELVRLGKMDEFIDEYDYEIVRQKLINTYKIEGHEQGRTEGKVEGEKSIQLEIAKRM